MTNSSQQQADEATESVAEKDSAESTKKPIADEVTDSDYMSVFGYGSNTPTNRPPPVKRKPNVAIVDNQEVCEILVEEGFPISESEIKALNFFLSPIDAFQYALYGFGKKDFYIVLMINKRKRTVYGYHVLDLTQDYSIADDIANRMKTKDIIL